MSIMFSEGFDNLGTVTVRVPILRAWYQRLLRRKPAGCAYVQFSVRFDDAGWHSAEVTANYPEGVDEIRLCFEARLDGEPIHFGHCPVIADGPCAT